VPCPGRFTPGKETHYPLYRRLGEPQGWSGWVQKMSPPLGFDPWTFQPVAVKNETQRRCKTILLTTAEYRFCSC